MNFRPRGHDEPEINLIPFIDVLLVVLIFLMLSTTYSKFTELQLKLPEAEAEAQKDRPRELIVSVNANGRYAINKSPLGSPGVEALSAALAQASQGSKDLVLIISADASASHQSVINVMEAARRTGLRQVTFATQTPTSAGSR